MKKLLKDKIEIIAWLDKYKIENYTLIEDAEYGYKVDVEGSVDLNEQKLEAIAVKFNIVTGEFDCSYNKLMSLEGCPVSVGEYFFCDNNQLKSLEYCPISIGESFWCNDNQITSLKFCPTSIKDFSCSNNKLTTLEHCPALVGRDFYCSNNQITSLEYLPTSVGQEFGCNGNPLLSTYQDIVDFEKLKGTIASDIEKSLLSSSLGIATKSTLHKV